MFLKNKFKLRFVFVFTLVSVLFISTIFISDSSKAESNANNEEMQKLLEDVGEYEDLYVLADYDLQKEMISKVKKAIESNEIKLSEPTAVLNYDLSSLRTYVKNKDDMTFYIPISYENLGENILNESSLNIVIKDKKIFSTQEFKILGNSKEYTADVSVYSNGKVLKKEEEIQFNKSDFEVDSDESTNVLSYFKPDTANAASFYAKFKKCLEDAGVATWVIGAIGAACAVGCAVTAGIGCVACVTAVAGSYGNVGVFCLNRAMRK